MILCSGHKACNMTTDMWNVNLIMSHDSACMLGMWNPTKRLSEIITGVDNSGNEWHNCVTSFFPILDCEMLNVNMAWSLSRNTSIKRSGGWEGAGLSSGMTVSHQSFSSTDNLLPDERSFTYKWQTLEGVTHFGIDRVKLTLFTLVGN